MKKRELCYSLFQSCPLIQKLYFLFNQIRGATSILRPMSQQPPLPEVRHNAMLLWISEKTSPIVEPRPKVLICTNLKSRGKLFKTINAKVTINAKITMDPVFFLDRTRLVHQCIVHKTMTAKQANQLKAKAIWPVLSTFVQKVFFST